MQNHLTLLTVLLILSNLPGVVLDPLLSAGVIFAFRAKTKVPGAVGPTNTHSRANQENPSAQEEKSRDKP